MLLKYFYDEALAHASYMVGCQRAKIAIVIDPGRDVDQYLKAAEHEGLEITAIAETHIHADYVSGARELAARIGADLYVSDEGPREWKYQYLADYGHECLKNGDTFHIGNILFEVLHTPGHTPESISFLITDEGSGANEPMGIFTGDFVFVGSIGRPDLLEEAAGIKGTAEPGARDLFRSAQLFKHLPDYLQVWPAHGAGSACGKGLGAIPSTTVGYEKLFNPALQFDDEDAFVDYILEDQPEAPKYFALMKRVNKEGPRVLGRDVPIALGIKLLEGAVQEANVVDLSPSSRFADGHYPRTLNIPVNLLAAWAGWLLDYALPVYLIGDENQIPEAVRVLRKIGVEDIGGFFKARDVREASLDTETYSTAVPEALASRIDSQEVQLVDVRSDVEWNKGHIRHAEHLFLGRLPDHVHKISRDKPVVVQCQTGTRSAIAASVLQAAGYEVINMTGGYQAWNLAGLPIIEPEHQRMTVLSSKGGSATS